MAILVGIDETSSTQDATQSGATSNDVSTSLPVLFSTALSFETLAGTVNPVSATALSGATTATSSGTNVIPFTGNQTDVGFTTSAGVPVAGLDSGLTTTAGRKIYLYTSTHDNNVLLGREANADGTANTSGLVAFALYMDTGTGTASDAGSTGAKLWMAQFEAIHQNDPTLPNDYVALATDLYVSESTQINFSLSGAPSGQNLFLMFGDGTWAAGETEIVVTGKHPANESTGASITTGDSVNTGQGGGGTTIGTNNQMIDPGEGMYFTFVKGGAENYTVPNLDQTEADVEANIQFDSYLTGARAASFDVVQLQPPKGATILITAIDNQDHTEVGTSFIDGLGDGDDHTVNIDSVSVTRLVKTGKTSTLHTYTFTSSGSDGGITVDLSGETAKVTGVVAGDHIQYHTDADHNRVLIDNAGNSNANLNAAIDIGAFRLESSSLTPADVGNVAFIDDAPTLAFGDLIGTGTLNPQYGAWSMSAGADGLMANSAGAGMVDGGVNVTMTAFDLVKPDGNVVAGTSYTFSETAPSPDGNGNYQFTGSVTGDLDNNPNTGDITEHFTMTVKTDGTYSIDLLEGFQATTTESTANGTLGAGGPDAVQTLTVGSDHIVFFSAVATASASDLITLGTQTGAPDFTEAQLETAHNTSIIDFARAMNVSTSGIGDGNNNLDGDAIAGIGTADESFVANPGTQFTSAKVFVDNSVTGYDYTHGERLYYRLLYADGTDSGQVLVSNNVATTGSKPVAITVDGGGKLIDAIQLTMGTGTVKIPEIQFITTTNNLADGLNLSFEASIRDGDGDPATGAFSVNLSANALNSTLDYVLNGTALALDWFNVDLTQSQTKYQVNGFDTGTGGDKLVLLGSSGATVNIDNSGDDSIVTVHESGGQNTVVTVVGVDMTTADIALM